ncbi:hypothetical protein K1719_002351 [Acacia pycnantha]|nr:hypothetical protein K1719_002351 [Acacia pycnantha]
MYGKIGVQFREELDEDGGQGEMNAQRWWEREGGLRFNGSRRESDRVREERRWRTRREEQAVTVGFRKEDGGATERGREKGLMECTKKEDESLSLLGLT